MSKWSPDHVYIIMQAQMRVVMQKREQWEAGKAAEGMETAERINSNSELA